MSSSKIVKINSSNPDNKIIQEAADLVREGGLVIIPTETVYGIAANMSNKKAISKLYEIKHRPEDKKFSLHICNKDTVEEFASSIPSAAYKLMDKFWPGPLTLIFNAKEDKTIGMRMPDNNIALGIIEEADVPVVCPSANISGKKPPVSFEEAILDLDGLVDMAVDAGPCRIALESSVVDLTIKPIRVLREAAISKDNILKVANKKTILFVCTGNSCRSVMAKYLLEKKMQQQKRDDVEVLSAGIMMLSGLGASEATRAILEQDGIDASGHISQRITKDLVVKSDIIIVMERLQEKRVLELFPEAKKKLFLLKEFARINDNNFDIDDPIGRSFEYYQNIYKIIKDAVDKISGII